MRITNGMMINNTLSHINQNKLNVDKYNTQEATGKKIQRPSDDPVIAVRALRFRSQLAEMAQYLEIGLRAYQYYESATNYPNIPSLIKLADYFAVTTDYLLGRSQERE